MIIYIFDVEKRQTHYFFIPKFLYSNNGGVCDVTQGDRIYSSQMKGLIAKVTNLKYDVLMTCLDRDIQISRYKQFRHNNEINMKISHVQFLRNHWFSNRKLPESCRKLAIASGRGVARIKS